MLERKGRERLLTYVLVPAIVVGVVVLGVFTFRTTFQIEQLRQQSVLEATLSVANEKVDRLDKRIIEEDNVVLAEADVSQLASIAPKWLATAARETPTIRAVVVVDARSPTHDVHVFASRAGGGPEDDAFRRLLVERMWGDLDLSREPADELRHLHRVYDGQSYLVSYAERTAGARAYLVVAWHDVPRVVHEMLPRLYRDAAGTLRMNVVDEDGKVVYGPPLRGEELTVGKPFPTTLYGWRLQVSLVSAEELRDTVERRKLLETLMVGLASLVVVAGMIAVLVATERDRRLSALKSEFVANVSHELKTPLSLVRMFAELLSSGRVASDEKRREYLQIISSESERLSALIENVLDFAKLERSRSAFDKHERDVGELVARAVDVYHYRAEREGVTVEVEVPEGDHRALVDERAIELVVINLLDNALKYAKSGGWVKVAVASGAKLVTIRVADRGPGIPDEERRSVFDRFVRGSGASRDKEVRGSGIGLSLVRHIAESHGGRAWVEPGEGGVGAIFVVTIARGRSLASEARRRA